MGPSGHESIEELTAFARDVLGQLGTESLTFYGKHQSDKRFDQNLVTEAELHLRTCFEEVVNGRFPHHQVFDGTSVTDTYTHDASRYLWIFDPIDGVDNFQTGIPIWGMSLALLENFWPVLGMFHMPATGDLFHAMADRTAYHGDSPISIPERSDVDDQSLLLTFSRFHQHYQSGFPGKIRNLGCTAAHLCYVALGRADAAIISNESYQDLAAVRVIVESAGGKFFKMDGSAFFLNDFLDGKRIDEHVLALAPNRYDSIREHL